MECIYDRTIRFSETGGEFVVGCVVAWHLADNIMDGRRPTPSCCARSAG